MDIQYDKSGNIITNPAYKEIIRLHEMLEKAGIPHTFGKCLDGWQVCYPVNRLRKNCVADAIEYSGTYGAEKDRIELMGLLTPREHKWDSVKGDLTAENVFNRMKKHWEENKKCE